MARYTTDVLKLFGAVALPDPATTSYNDTRGFWGFDINTVIIRMDSEFGLVYAGNPNQHVASTYIGKKVYDTVGKKVWVAQNVGDATTAVWAELRTDPQHRLVTVPGASNVNYNLTALDDIVEIKLDTPAAINLNLPTGLGSDVRKLIRVVDGAGNASDYNLTVSSADLIRGAATFVIDRDWSSYGFLWNGTTWRII